MVEKKLDVSDRWIELCRTKTWVDILEETTRRFPEGEALVFEEERISFQEYQDSVNAVAKGLYAIGVRPGDHVALWMTNRPEWCYARHAVYKLGATRMIPVNTRYRVDDGTRVLREN